jgi:hypothetical protein
MYNPGDNSYRTRDSYEVKSVRASRTDETRQHQASQLALGTATIELRKPIALTYILHHRRSKGSGRYGCTVF